jgi:hypothetical protein
MLFTTCDDPIRNFEMPGIALASRGSTRSKIA